MSEIPEANDKSIREHKDFGKLFDATPVPEYVEGFKVEEGEKLQELWPEGMDNAKEVSVAPQIRQC
jgi:deoxyribodipyrimidine photo-lyase